MVHLIMLAHTKSDTGLLTVSTSKPGMPLWHASVTYPPSKFRTVAGSLKVVWPYCVAITAILCGIITAILCGNNSHTVW